MLICERWLKADLPLRFDNSFCWRAPKVVVESKIGAQILYCQLGIRLFQTNIISNIVVYLNENTALTQRGCQCWGLLRKKMQSNPATKLNFAQSSLHWPVKHPPELWNNLNGEFTGTKVKMIHNKLFWHLINLQTHRSVSQTRHLNETMRPAVLNHVAVFSLNRS